MPQLDVGQVFFSKWLKHKGTDRHIPIKVVSVDRGNNKVVVDYGGGAGPEEWVLSHCENAFYNGDYLFPVSITPLYELSKNFDILYDLIYMGCGIACFVDYRWTDGEILRDICECKKRKGGHITFSARGIEYGGIYPFDDSKDKPEKVVFVEICKAMNVEFILPELYLVDGESIKGFVPVDICMPHPRTRCYVIAEGENGVFFQTMAEYIAPMTVLFEDYCHDDWEESESGDYDEEKDCYYTPEGWYEWQSEPDINWKMTAKVVKWKPLFEIQK